MRTDFSWHARLDLTNAVSACALKQHCNGKLRLTEVKALFLQMRDMR